MIKKSSILIAILLFLFLLVFSSFKRIENSNSQGFNKTLTNDVFAYIAINQILMYVSNNGDGSHDPATDGNGFYWPGGINAVNSAIFEDGLIWGGKIGRETRVNGNTHRQGLQAGKILPSGDADDAFDPKYRVYKIRKGWEQLPPGPEKDAFQRDYESWPVEDGAPWVDIDGDGLYTSGIDQPHFIGDEVLWYVANDLNETRATFTYGAAPIGLEFQTTVFGFNRSGDLGDIVFKKYLVINKSTNVYKDVVFGYWSDTDLGYAGDDFTGCDTVLSLGYTYNADNDDNDVYGTPPPAVGYDFFQGPIVESPGDTAKFLAKPKPGYRNVGLTAFTLYINSSAIYSDPQQGVAQGSIEFYRYLTGLLWNGNPFIDPHTGNAVNFTVAGDPVNGTGWYEGDGWPSGPAKDDRRHVMASGSQRDPMTGELASSLTLAPGDSQEIVVGIIIAVGADNLDSVRELKRKDFAAQIAFDLDFQLTQAPPAPKTHAVAHDREIRLYWEDNAESYDEFDQIISGRGFPDTTYTFQGYRVWQFSDETGSDPTLIGQFDVTDFYFDSTAGEMLPFTTIYENRVVNGVNTQIPIINGDNLGIKRFLTVTRDALTGAPLRNGTPYYFSVTAYGYSPYSVPTSLENPPVIFEVRPETQKVDVTYDYELDDVLIGEAVSGDGDGILRFQITNPDILTGHTYMAYVYGSEDNGDLSWTLVDEDVNDTLVNKETYFAYDTDTVKFFDGFSVLLQNRGQDSIDALPGVNNSAIKSVLEIANASGTLEEPVDVITGLNSTGDWSIKSYGSLADGRQNINWSDNAGVSNYEIRFTNSGSEYYLSGYSFGLREPVLKNEPKAKDTVPFELWNIGTDLESAADDIRLTIKVRDENKIDPSLTLVDSTWSQLPNGDWEPVYGYLQDSNYVEPLPDMSGTSRDPAHPIGRITFNGDIPESGTVIRITTWKPVEEGDVWSIVATAPNLDDKISAKNRLDDISVFPNPYFGANDIERDKYQKFVRFTNLPSKVTVRIYSIAGVFINKLEKDDQSQWLDWSLLNIDNLPVATGIYIAHLDMPGIGEKIMKIAVIQEKQIIDRL